jgi:glycosyltransferase involved in cell wall biosynthesis
MDDGERSWRLRSSGRPRVGYLARYTADKASSRTRVYEWLPYLERRGIDTRVVAWEGTTRLRYVFAAVRVARWADTVVLQKPFQPRWFIRVLSTVARRVVLDIDDALWESVEGAKDQPSDGVQRLVSALERSSLLIAGSSYIATWGQEKVDGLAVAVVPPCVSLEKYDRVRLHIRREPLRLAWMGSVDNRADLDLLQPVLADERIAGLVSLMVIADGRPMLGAPSVGARWTLEDEVALLTLAEVGVMPLIDTARQRGRCGYKAVQYMAVGLPVVASPVGGAQEVVIDGVTGFLAGSAEEWVEALIALTDCTLRKRMGAAGRQQVEEQLSFESSLDRYLEAVLPADGVRTLVPGAS